MPHTNLFEMPFLDEFEERLKSGAKTATTRSNAYGAAGDEFTAFGARFRLTEVRRTLLGEVQEKFWAREGCATPAEFEAVWVKLHPRAGFDVKRPVWLHLFERVQGK